VSRGDVILVHTATRPLFYGAPEPGPERYDGMFPYAEAVLDMLLDLIGAAGTLLMLTDSDKHYIDVVQRGQVFDYRTAPSRRGLATELLRRREGAYRSLNPLYNVTGLGPRAEELVGEHWRSSPYTMDEHSPYWKLTRVGGKVVLLGVYYEVNSSIHLVEYMHPQEIRRPLFFDRPVELRTVGYDGEVLTLPILRHARYLPDWALPPFCRWLGERHGGFYRERRIHGAPVVVYDARVQYEATYHELKENDVVWYDAELWEGVEPPRG
jgi:aminoglycoside N3'-acetyltransferase